MNDILLMKKTSRRLLNARADILNRYPFFGRLLMRLPFGFTDCETAYTDMKKIVFDVKFASRLSDRELCFVLLHELMHCVLKHCTRGGGKLRIVYNVACDIVVNSLVLEAMGEQNMTVDGAPVMHFTPDGREGKNFSAEDVYYMILHESEKNADNADNAAPDGADGATYGLCSSAGIDSHDIWSTICACGVLENIWDRNILSAAGYTDKGSGIPDNIKRVLIDVSNTPKINWKQVLHDFIQYDRSDYSFMPPDRRYGEEFMLPAFNENVSGSRIEKVWFLVDTSGSISDEVLSEAMKEIKSAVNQIENVSGMLSFFDTKVSEPVDFDNCDELSKIKPAGGGGTSFTAIFRSIPVFFKFDYPECIIILTDGIAPFPSQTESLNIPVFWIIVNNHLDPPWGECVHIYT